MCVCGHDIGQHGGSLQCAVRWPHCHCHMFRDVTKPLTDQERLQKRFAGEWPAFTPPPPRRSLAAIMIRPSGDDYQWQVRAGTYRSVGYATDAKTALECAYRTAREHVDGAR